MAAALSSSAAVATRPCVVVRRASQARPIRAVRVEAQKHDAVSTVKLAAAGLAAGLLMQTGVAQAGVQMVQPEIKKVFQADDAPKEKAAKATKAPKVEAPPAPSVQEGGPSVASLGISGSLVFLAGFTFLFSQGENGEFMSEALLKDSTGYAGYEPVLKTGPFYGDEEPVKVSKSKKGKKGFF